MSQAAIAMGNSIGGQVGRFAITAKLGYGGMGEVFLAEDSILKRQVALKAIKAEHSEDQKSHQRLLKEAERASQLNDEHIARIYDIVEHEGTTFLVMEYVEGQTLRHRLSEPVSTEEFFSIAEQGLSGLAAAHRRGIVHCDLKPENLMITPSGQVKILDFGFARRIPTNETRSTLEMSEVLLGGTPGYIPPEVLMGSVPDERSDIFSMGVVLYETLAGHHPFRSAGNGGTAAKILSEEPLPVPASAPRGLDSVLERMLAKTPQQRYQTCVDVLADIRAIHAGGKPATPKTSWIAAHLPVSRASILLVAALAVAMVLLKVWSPVGQGTHVEASSRQLVILPFKPVSDDPNSRAYADGLTDTMSAKLGQVSDRYPLEIVSLSEAQKQTVNDAQQARSILGATMALEGSMQFSGNIVRVSYKLVDTKSLLQLHSGVITADAANSFAVQDRVIEEVLKILDIELAQEDQGKMQAHGTTQSKAYESYLRGRGYLQEYDRAGNIDNAITAFQQSIAADPRFALGYAALGQAYIFKYGAGHSPESVAAARQACSRSVEIDGSSADGEICLGMLFNKTGEYDKAAQHLEQAAKIDPTRQEAYRELGFVYQRLKRLDDAEAVFKKAIALRPQYWAGYKSLGRFYYDQGRYDDAVEQYKHVIALAPDSYSGYSSLGGIYIVEGKYAEAIDALERSNAIRPNSHSLSNLAIAYFYEHRYQQAADSYERALQIPPIEYFMYGNLAEAYDQITGKQEESRNNYTRALEFAQQQLSVNPNDSSVLLDAAFYSAMLGQRAPAENYRVAGLKLAARDPHLRLRSAQVLAQLHQDSRAIGELEQALKMGLSATEIANNPFWQRFAVYPKYQALLANSQKH
ncbi:MAG TPA: protein kinase [Candidatus Angelobacter sp.]